MESLRVAQFDAWQAPLDDALAALPEMATCPHELYRLVCTNSSSTAKRFALVSLGDEPVAVAALRRRQRHWEPAMYAVAHDAIMPAKDGYLYRALSALGLDVWVNACESEPPARWVRSIQSFPRYAMRCDADYEQYWRETGIWSSVKPARRRTRDFTFEVDAPGAAEWTIRGWGERWEDDDARETVVLDDLLLSASYYQARGGYHTFRLLDGDRPVAGHNFFVHGRSIVLQTTYFDAEYRRIGAGSRLYDLVFAWAAERGYEKVDIGGGHEYKSDWAPQDGVLWTFNVCPDRVYRVKQATRFVSNALHQTRALTRARAARRTSSQA